MDNKATQAKSRPDFMFAAQVKRFFTNHQTRLTQPELAHRLQIPCPTLRSYLSGVSPFPVSVRTALENLMSAEVHAE